MKFRIDRDSVCAGDDVDGHLERWSLPDDSSLADLLQQLQAKQWYPSIQGGRAAWQITNADPRVGKSITLAIVAQEWDWQPRFLVDPHLPLQSLINRQQRRDLFVHYRTQEDPEKLFTKLSKG